MSVHGSCSICRQEFIIFLLDFTQIETLADGGLEIYLISYNMGWCWDEVQFIPRNMHTVFDLLCFVVVIHWLIFPYPSGLLHWHCSNLTIAPVPAKQPWWMDKYFMWIHYGRLHNHNKAKHNKTVCIFLGIYCIMALHDNGRDFCLIRIKLLIVTTA